jgi:hypothetical protein
MPYFIFAMKPFAQLEKLAEFEAFKDASAQAKVLRAAQPEGAPRIKVMFGDTQLAAEDQLLQLREGSAQPADD